MMKYCWLLLLCCSPVAQAQQDAVLDKLLLLSGLEAVVASYPGQLAAQFGRAGVPEPNSKIRTEARQRLLDSYNKTDIQGLLRNYVQAGLSREEMQAIVAWFESKLGRRFMRAESQAGTAAGARALGESMAWLNNAAPDNERVRLVRQFEEAARLTDINLGVIRVMYETELLAVNAMLEKTQRHSNTRLTQDMQQQFYDMQTMMMPGLLMRMLAVSSYVFEDFTDAEIQAYIDFLDSAAGRKLVGLYGRAPIYIYGQVVRGAGIDNTEGFLQIP